MIEEDRDDLRGIESAADDQGEDAAEALMTAAFDAGLRAENDNELDPEEQFDDEAVKVGRTDDVIVDFDDDDREPYDDRQWM